MNPRVTRGSVLSALAALALTPASAVAQSAPLLRVGSGLEDQVTPVLYAQQAGLFTRAGLNVEITKLASGNAVAAAVAGGALEIGKSSVPAIINAHVRGIPFTMIAPVSVYRSEAPDVGLLVVLDSPIRTGRDLNGKTIAGTALGDLNSVSTAAWIDQNGGDSKTVHFVELPPPAIAGALEQGRIDAAPAAEPVLSSFLAGGKVRVAARMYDAVSHRFQTTAWFALSDWVEKNRDAAVRFAQVVHDANVYVGAHESETIPLIAAFVGVDPATLTKIRRPARSPYLDAGEIQPVIDLLARYKTIPKPFSAQDLISPYALKAPK